MIFREFGEDVSGVKEAKSLGTCTAGGARILRCITDGGVWDFVFFLFILAFFFAEVVGAVAGIMAPLRKEWVSTFSRSRKIQLIPPQARAQEVQ